MKTRIISFLSAAALLAGCYEDAGELGVDTATRIALSPAEIGFTADGTTVSVRPSGTEPKIKFYFGVKAPLASVADFDKTLAELDAKIEGIKKDLKLE